MCVVLSASCSILVLIGLFPLLVPLAGLVVKQGVKFGAKRMAKKRLKKRSRRSLRRKLRSSPVLGEVAEAGMRRVAGGTRWLEGEERERGEVLWDVLGEDEDEPLEDQ